MKMHIGLATLFASSFAALAQPPGGEPSQGLATRIETAATKLKVGDPIQIRYTMTNLTAQPLKLWHSGFWPNHRVRVCDQTGVLVKRTPAGQQRFDAFAPGGGRGKNFPADLAPGAEDATEGNYNLLDFYDLSKPGVYSVQYVYEEYQSGWQGQVSSNVLILSISGK